MPCKSAITIDLPLPAYDVVIPCHDRAHVVADAVASVLAQEPAPVRVVVVDDGSNDDSAAVILALEAAHPGRVVAAILPRNGGASNARNVGAALCRSPWIAFLDSDDVWLPGAARALLAAGEGADVVCGHFARVEGDGVAGEPECGWWGDDIRVALTHGGVIGPSWAIVRRRTVAAVAGFDPASTIATTGTSTPAPRRRGRATAGSTTRWRCTAPCPAAGWWRIPRSARRTRGGCWRIQYLADVVQRADA
ncbi:glycosyltransferase family 2 protein [Sphingomonas sp. MMS24-JH45]